MTNPEKNTSETTTLVAADVLTTATKTALRALHIAGAQAGWDFDIRRTSQDIIWEWTRNSVHVVVGGWHGEPGGFGKALLFGDVCADDNGEMETDVYGAEYERSSIGYPYSELGDLFDGVDAEHYLSTVIPAIVAAVSELLAG